jgi:hypothetical protein
MCTAHPVGPADETREAMRRRMTRRFAADERRNMPPVGCRRAAEAVSADRGRLAAASRHLPRVVRQQADQTALQPSLHPAWIQRTSRLPEAMRAAAAAAAAAAKFRRETQSPRMTLAQAAHHAPTAGTACDLPHPPRGGRAAPHRTGRVRSSPAAKNTSTPGEWPVYRRAAAMPRAQPAAAVYSGPGALVGTAASARPRAIACSRAGG